MKRSLIKDMLIDACKRNDEKAISFLTQLCLDHNVSIERIKEWSKETTDEARPS